MSSISTGQNDLNSITLFSEGLGTCTPICCEIELDYSIFVEHFEETTKIMSSVNQYCSDKWGLFKKTTFPSVDIHLR